MRWLLVLFSFSGLALAQEVLDPGLITGILDLGDWLLTAETYINMYDDAIIGLSYRLVIVGFVFGALSLSIRGGSGGLELLRRLVFSAIFIGVSPLVNVMVASTWENVRLFSSQNLSATFSDAVEEFRTLEQATGEALMTTAAATASASTGVREGATTIGTTSGGRSARIVTRSVLFSMPLLMVAIIIMFFFFVLSGIIISIAQVILPLSGGLMAFAPAIGQSWFSAYVKTVTGSLLFILVFPLAFDLLYDITTFGPASRLSERLTEWQADFNTETTALDTETGNLARIAEIEGEVADVDAELSRIKNDCAFRVEGFGPCTWRTYTATAQTLIDQFKADKSALLNEKEALTIRWWERGQQWATEGLKEFSSSMLVWVANAVMMILMIVIAIFAIFKLEGMVSGLVGSVALGASAAAGAVAGFVGSQVMKGLSKMPNPSLGGSGAATQGNSATSPSSTRATIATNTTPRAAQIGPPPQSFARAPQGRPVHVIQNLPMVDVQPVKPRQLPPPK